MTPPDIQPLETLARYLLQSNQPEFDITLQ